MKNFGAPWEQNPPNITPPVSRREFPFTLLAWRRTALRRTAHRREQEANRSRANNARRMARCPIDSVGTSLRHRSRAHKRRFLLTCAVRRASAMLLPLSAAARPEQAARRVFDERRAAYAPSKQRMQRGTIQDAVTKFSSGMTLFVR